MALLEAVASFFVGEPPVVLTAVVAVVGVLVWFLFVNKITRSPVKGVKAHIASGTSNDAKAPERPEGYPEGFDCMGEIEPLTNLDYAKTRPERIYKFADRYNLTMGLRKTTINTITRIDEQYVERIEERKRILEKYPGALGCVPSGEAMVREFYEFLVTHYLPKRYPTVFVRGEDKQATPSQFLHNRILDQKLPMESPSDIIDTLRIIALTVDEDFLMLQPDSDGDGYALTAMVWLYPVGFDPVDKLGIKLRDAHGPVPGYKQHLQTSMERYFSRLKPGSVVDRINWAVATNSSLCERGEYHLYDDNQVSTMAPSEIDINDTWVRCELQTLFALPRHSARILSVHLYLYPIREIKQVGLAEVMERAIDGYGKGNAPAFARYKRIPVWGEAVKAYLRSREDPPQAAAKSDSKQDTVDKIQNEDGQ